MRLHPCFKGYGRFLLFLCLGGCADSLRMRSVLPTAPVPQVAQQLHPRIVWHCTVGHGVGSFYSRLRPAYDGEKIYAADRYGVVAAVHPRTGKKNWQTKIKMREANSQVRWHPLSRRSALLAGGIVLSGDRLFLGSERAELIALQKQSGDLLWRVVVGGEIISQPVVHGDQVLVHTNNGIIHAFKTEDGRENWRLDLNVPSLALRGSAQPVITPEGIVIVGGKDGVVRAVQLANGSLLWQQELTQPVGRYEIEQIQDIAAMPVVVGERLFVMNYQNCLVALNLYTGAQLWQKPIGSATDFIHYEGTLYIVDKEDTLIAIDSRNGSELWRQNALHHRKLTPPAIFEGYLVVADKEGYLCWIDLADGHFVAQQRLERGGFYAAPLVVDQQLLIQSRSGNIYAVIL